MEVNWGFDLEKSRAGGVELQSEHRLLKIQASQNEGL